MNLEDMSLKLEYLLQKRDLKERQVANNELILKEIEDLKAEIENLKDALGLNNHQKSEKPHNHQNEDLTFIPIFECC